MCKRRGYCCQDVRLAESPDMLEKAYHYWKKSSSIDPKFSDIYIIYPMLTFKYENPEKDFSFHYYCKHFKYNADGISTCTIYDIRPQMCRNFPYYDDVEYLDRDGSLSPYEGCGYNDPD